MDKKVLAEKLGILQDMAAKQENFLELTAVLDCLRDVQVTPEELEEVYSRLERKGIRVGTPEGDAELEPELELRLAHLPADRNGKKHQRSACRCLDERQR